MHNVSNNANKTNNTLHNKITHFLVFVALNSSLQQHKIKRN